MMWRSRRWATWGSRGIPPGGVRLEALRGTRIRVEVVPEPVACVSRRQRVQEGTGAEDRHALVALKILEFAIAGHQVVGPSAQSGSQHEVVLRMGRHPRYVRRERGHAGPAALEGKVLGNLRCTQAGAKVRLLEGAGQLGEYRLQHHERKRAGKPGPQ